MHLDDNPDYMTIWKLAHQWVQVDPSKSDESAIPLEIKKYIHRLLEASYSMKISIRTRQRRIFMDESCLSLIVDCIHTIKFLVYLKGDKLSKHYLDSLYVKRNEVLNWCINVAYLDPPPCWAFKSISTPEHPLAGKEDSEDENNSWYGKLTDRRRKITGCLELARMLWKQNPNQSYDEIYDHPMMKQYGNPSVFSKESFQIWAKEYSSDFAKKGGRRKESKG